jgi:hypothetical protein
MRNKEDLEFPPEIQEAFAAYPQPRPSRGFEARFWADFERRRGRYRGLVGFLRRMLELEIEGVMVWRLALSTLSGGVSCVLVLGLLFGFANQKTTPDLPLPGKQMPAQIPLTPMNAYAFYNRDWENELLLPQQKPKLAPLKARPKGRDFSWSGSSGHWA